MRALLKPPSSLDIFHSCKCAISPRVILSHFTPTTCRPSAHVLILCVLVLLVLTLCTNRVRCELNPPKRLHRVIAGFYAYHPSYDTDKPAPILTLQPASSKNNVQYHYQQKKQIKHQHQDLGDHYVYQYGYGGKAKSGNHHKPKHYVGHYAKKSKYKSTTKSKSKSKSKSVTKGYSKKSHHGHPHYPYWGVFSKLIDTYVVLAHRMAEHYGHKYNYPVDLLYWQIIDVMFD